MAALFVLGALGATLAFELALRVSGTGPLWRVLPQPEVALYGPDHDTGYRHRPNVRGVWLSENRVIIITNSLGFRDRERPITAPAGIQRALVVGDSRIEALQVDLIETAVFVAERELAKRHANIEVVNLGLAGASPAVQVARLRAHGLGFQPEVAVVVTSAVAFLTAKSTEDGDFPLYRSGADGRFELSYRFRESAGYRFRTSSSGRAFYWALDNFALARVLNARKNVGLLAEWARAATPARPDLSPARSCSLEPLDRLLGLWRDGKPSQSRGILDAFLRDLGDIGRDRKIRIALGWQDIGERCTGAVETRRNELIAVIAALNRKHGLDFLDMDWRLDEAVEFRPNGTHRFYGVRGIPGGHLNAAGNAQYGRIIADAIERLLLTR